MRPGLTPKKMTVRGKGGFFQRRYWVLPDFKQAMRLSKVKNEARQEGLPTQTSQQRMQDWLRAKKVTGEASQVTLLQEFFRRKDGTTIIPEDLEKMWADPASRTVPVMKFKLDADGKMIKDPSTGEHLVEPELGPDGKPKTRLLEPKIELTKIDVSSDEVSFGAKIMDPGPPSEAIGTIYRVFTRDKDGNLNVSHDLFKIDSRFGGGGLGSEIIRNQISSYPGLGVTKVTVGTAWVGRYTWLSMGFEPQAIYKKTLSKEFDIFAGELTGSEKRLYFKEGVSSLLKPDKTPYTIKELRDIYDFQNKPGWQVAGAEIPVWDEKTGKEGTRKLAKEFMLHRRTDGWEGSIDLTPGSTSAERIRSYLKINPGEQEVSQLLSDADVAIAESNLAGQKGDWSKAQALQNKARGLVQTAQEKQQAVDRAAAKDRAVRQAYADNDRAYAAQQKKLLQETVSKLPKSLPEEYVYSPSGMLDRHGLTEANAERMEGVQRTLRDQGITREARSALLAEQGMLYAAGNVAQKKATIAYADAHGGSETEKRRLRYELAAALHAERTAQETWIAAMQAPGANVTISAGPMRQEEEDADKARAKRNFQAAQSDIMAATTPSQQAAARGVLDRVRELKQMEPFDEQEAAEIRQEQIGLEASRKLGSGLAALARVRREDAQTRDELEPKSKHQTREDREILVSNKVRWGRVLRLAEQEVAKQQAAFGPDQDERVKEAKKKLMAAKNMVALNQAALRRRPADAVEAEQMRARQRRLLEGEGWPPSLQAFLSQL